MKTDSGNAKNMYVIVDPTSKRLCRTSPNTYGHSQFDSLTGAKRSLAAYIKRKMKYGSKRDQDEALTYVVMTLEDYNATMRATKIVRNLMTGKEVEIDVNTPLSCDPSSETYWILEHVIMFGLFTNTKKYRLHLSGGSTIDLKGVKKVEVTLDRATQKIESYNLTFANKSYNTLFHVSPSDIVAIEEL